MILVMEWRKVRIQFFCSVCILMGFFLETFYFILTYIFLTHFVPVFNDLVEKKHGMKKNFDHACLDPFADGRDWGRLSETHPDQHNLFSDVSTWSWPAYRWHDLPVIIYVWLKLIGWKKMMAVTLTFGHIVLDRHVGNRKYCAPLCERGPVIALCVKMLQIQKRL